MGRLSSKKRRKQVKLNQRQIVVASSPQHVVTAQSQSEAVVGDEIPAVDCLPGLNRANIQYLTDFDHGLLDELIRLGVINREKYEPFRNIKLNEEISGEEFNHEERSQLMDDVISASTAHKELFLSALDRTQQSHVTNYIRHDGQRPADTSDDNWPSFTAYHAISEHFRRLVHLIDIDCSLLDEVISAGILNDRQKEAVFSKKLSDKKRVDYLLNIMTRKSIADYRKFIDCLVKTKQFLVVPMLDPLTAAIHPPLSKDHRAKLDANQSALLELIDTQKSGLLTELLAVDCLTFWQKDYIESTKSDVKRTRRLLNILRRGSQSDFDKFILCLGRTGQRHVANLLLTDTVVSQIIARGPAVDKYQSFILQAFRQELQNSSDEVRQQLLSQALGPDNELIFMRTTQSITLYIASRSLSGLMHLHDMYLNTQLKITIQQIFSELLQNKKGVIIDALIWDSSDYDSNVQQFVQPSCLSIYAKIYHYSSDITTTSTTTFTELPVSSLSTDTFPHELIEVLLLKAAGQLFVTMKKITTNAATYTHVTISAVSRYWWQTLSYRRSNTRRLRRYFANLCRPFTFRPRPVTYLPIRGVSARGMVKFDGKLYVITSRSKTIDVYELADSSNYDITKRIRVSKSFEPDDLVVCSSTRCLFVTDRPARRIWRVNLSRDSNDVVDKTDLSPFIAYNLQYIPNSLSIQSERLLMTAAGEHSLYVHNINDVERSERINLPDNMYALHAVETSRKTFVVAHGRELDDYDTQSDHTGVSELSADGRVLRVYKGPITVGWPTCITTVNGHFLVIDYRNRQILHLNTDLELTQVLLADLCGSPRRQFYSPESGMLFLTYDGSNAVNIYEV